MGKVLHASYSGYFPFCLQESDSALCLLSLKKIMKLYWRVKKFILTGTGTYQYPPPFNFSGQVLFDPVEILNSSETEEELVCSSHFSFSREEDSSVGEIILNEESITKKKLNNENFFSFSFSCSFPFGLYIPEQFGSDSFFAYTSLQGPITGHTLRVFDTEIPIQAFVGEGSVWPSTSGVLNLFLTPAEWFEYKNKEGVPLYDKNTGERIVD